MYRIASFVARISMILAVLVAVATAGYLLSTSLVGTPRAAACEYQWPNFARNGIQMGKEVVIEAGPVDCLDPAIAPGSVDITLKVENSKFNQLLETSAPMNSDGSYKAVLPLDPRTAGNAATITVTTTTSVPNCKPGDASNCAASRHLLSAVVD